jgi:hypothetical protein
MGEVRPLQSLQKLKREEEFKASLGKIARPHLREEGRKGRKERGRKEGRKEG